MICKELLNGCWILQGNHDMNVKLSLIGRRSCDGHMYNLPTCSKVAALIVGMFEYE